MKTLFRVAILLLVSINFASCSPNLSDTEYLARAEKHLAAGKTRAALIELKNALKRNGNNARARFLLGKLAFEQGDPASAEKELERALKLGVPPEQVIPVLADARLQLGKYDELQEMDATALPARARARVLAAQGMARLAAKKTDDAEKLIDQALEEAPDSIHAQAAKARLLFLKNEQDEALALLKGVTERHPDHAEAWRLLGAMHQARREFDKAEKAYGKVLELRPDDLATRLEHAMSLIQLERFDAAQQDLDKIKKVAPQHGGTNYAQGLIHLGRKEMDEALSAFEQAVASGGANPLSLYFLGALHLAKGNLEQADTYTEQFLAKFPGNVAGRKLSARIKLKLNQPEAVEELLRPVVLQFEQDVDAMNLLAAALLKTGRKEEAVELLSKAAELQPESAQAQLRLGAGLLAEGEEARAAEYLRKAAELDPENRKADVLLIAGYLREKNYDAALETARKYREKNPDSALPWILIGRIELARGNREAAVEAFREAARLNPGDPNALSSLADLAIRQKRFDQAREYYERILAKHENHLGTLIRLSALDALEGEGQRMAQHLQEAIDAHPTAEQPRLALARYHLTRGEYDTAMTLLSPLNDKQKRNPAVLQTMGLIQLGQKDYAQAKITLERLVELRPTSAEAHYLLARAWGGLNKANKTRAELEKALELDPDHFLARLAYVRLLLTRKEIEPARKAFEPLRSSHADQPDVMRLAAAFALASGDRERAMRIYETLMEKTPDTRNLVTLAAMKWNMGKRDEAISLQEKWVQAHPEDRVALLALANNYLLANRIDDMIGTYEKLLQLAPDNIVALNNLAWYLRERDPQKALEYAESARELAPKAASILDTYAMVLLANGRKEKALRQIERAVQAAPDSPALQVHHARILAANSRKKEATKTLETLLAGHKQFPEREEAEKLLKELKPSSP